MLLANLVIGNNHHANPFRPTKLSPGHSSTQPKYYKWADVQDESE